MKNIKDFKQFNKVNETIYGHNVADPMVDKEWDDLYEEAKEEPLKSKIVKMLVEIFKDKDVLVAVADNYEWRDGSNGIINFSNLDQYITDIGYMVYADKPELIKNGDIEEVKEYILYAYASPKDGNLRKGEHHREHNYNPGKEFKW